MATRGTVVGLDVGRYAAKAAWALSDGENVRINRVELLRLPQDGTDRMEVIGPWIQKLGIQSLPCILALPGQQAMFQPFLVAAGDPRSLDQIVALEVVKFNEMASETMTYGFSPFSYNPGEQRILLAMARPSALDEVLTFARAMRLSLIDILPSPVALFNAMAAAMNTPEQPFMGVSIGNAATDVAVGSKAGLMFARSFPVGGQAFSDALAKARKLPAGQAENTKLSDGSLAEGNPTAPALSSVADLWISELQVCLSVYHSLFTDRKVRVSRLVLAGGGADLNGLPQYVEKKMALPTTRLDALPGAHPVKAPAAFAVAAGLAMAGSASVTAPISLLPESVRNELAFRRQKPFWIASAAMAALVLGISLLGGFRDIRKKETHLGEQRVSLTRRQQLADQIESIKSVNAQIREMAGPVKNLLRAGPLLRDLITLVSANLSKDDRIYLISDGESYFAPKPDAVIEPPGKLGMRDHRRTAQPPQTKPKEVGAVFEHIIVEGYTRRTNLSTIKQLITKLGDAEYVESVDLLSDDRWSTDTRVEDFARNAGMRRFVIDVKVRVP